MRSSYIANKYADKFAAIIDGFQPKVCVELGVLDGYSTVAIGLQLQKNKQGNLHAVDLFDAYPHKHGEQYQVQQLLADYGLESIITLQKWDAWTIADTYQPNTVDFLHVDLSNTGETVRRIMEQWDPLMVQGGVIIFEGGTVERDQIEWMIKYNGQSIKKELETNPIITEKYIFATYLEFPGLTMLLKKR